LKGLPPALVQTAQWYFKRWRWSMPVN
jgi:hypothetical protein